MKINDKTVSLLNEFLGINNYHGDRPQIIFACLIRLATVEIVSNYIILVIFHSDIVSEIEYHNKFVFTSFYDTYFLCNTISTVRSGVNVT